MLKIFDQYVDPKEALHSLIQNGIAIFDCNRMCFDMMTYKLAELIKEYRGIEPFFGFKQVPNRGYLYYIYNYNEFRSNANELDVIVANADAV